MEVSYYNLAGGINQALTKTELGLNTKKIYWADATNIEILQNRGIVKQKGNSLFLDIGEEITGITEMLSYDIPKLVITTVSGKIFIYDELHSKTNLINKTLTGRKPKFLNFLNGILIMTESDGLFYIKNNSTYDVVECGLKDLNGDILTGGIISAYKGRVWVAKNATIYYSALGSYNDFTTSDDAGYINEFYTDTGSITALHQYKDYLAIYKRNSVYLLSGTNPSDFAITLFADKGAINSSSILNVSNKQYFLSNGIFALEQVGELNQIQLGNEISLNIKDEFSSFENLSNTIALHYEKKNQIWYFFPYASDKYFHTIWINDYVNKAWYKRKVPQDIVTACVHNEQIYIADKNGKIYKDDYGTTFNGIPIDFMWKSPFLAITNPHHRKMIDEFYFLLDTEYDNNFKFSVFKDYDSELSDDEEHIYSVYKDHLIWADNNMPDHQPCHWGDEESSIPVWAVNKDTLEKAEISEANYSVQLCVEGNDITNSCAIIGLQFREVYIDD